jgi:hydroxylaminobenzene mutase
MLTALTFWAVLYGTYANLFVTTLAAILGANAMSPVTGGQGAPAWQEAIITGGFVTVGIAMLVSSALILWGFRRNAG